MFKQVSLRAKFAVLFVAVMAVLLVANYCWRSHVLHDQAEHEMLETTEVLAQEMDAIWDFMERNQDQFKQNEDGTYYLYCVVAAKSVSLLFTVNNERDFVIHYTNTVTRKPEDAPDSFELKALDALHADPELDSYYGLVEEADGSTLFRYAEPLYITESCLKCHGSPAGEIDIMGYPKEGLQEGDIAGVASIIMPADTYVDNIRSSLVQETGIFVLFILAGLAVIFFGISKLVTRPAKQLEGVAGQIERHDFDVNLAGIGDRDEMERLAQHFDSMAQQLQSLYDGLEAEVEVRTVQLRQSNEILEQQRRELESMNVRLEQENRYKGDFLAIMSHEIRTPLTSILAFADIWSRTNAPRNAEEESIMNEMRINSQILLGMVNNILEMARVEAGRSELVLEPVEIPDLLAAIRGSMRFLAEKKQVSLAVRIARDMPVLMLDGEKVRRILENLVSNAIKSVDEGGSVEMEATYSAQCEELVLVVKDDGCGIKAEDRMCIFERFVQGHDRSKHQHGGSGLGLAVVRELAELHGGSVELTRSVTREEAAAQGKAAVVRGEQAAQAGCTFTVRLKAQQGIAKDLE